MEIVTKNGRRSTFDARQLQRDMRKRGFNIRLAREIAEKVRLELESLAKPEVSKKQLSEFVGKAVLGAAETASPLENGKYFAWSELLPTIRSGKLRAIPSVVTLAAPSGRYVADHVSASRHLCVGLWSNMHNSGELAADVDEARRQTVKNRAYAAAVQFARAEAAIAEASQWLITPALKDRANTRAFLDKKRRALKDGADNITEGIDHLKVLAEKPREGAGATSTEAAKTKGLATDAIDQASAILESMLRLIGLLGGDVPDEDEDSEEFEALTDAVEALAGALGGGARAAIVGAIGDVIAAVADTTSATPEDIDVNVDPQSGEVTIYFRIEYSCLFVFDFLMDDDFVWIRKNAKTGAFTFSTGASAQRHHEQQLESD